MRQKRDGLIINIGSILGRVTFPFLGIYGASKFAVEALTDSLRYEVSRLGVEVVEVQPSAYPTNFFTGIQTPADIEVTKSYGEVGQIPDAMFKTFMSRFEGKDAPNWLRRGSISPSRNRSLVSLASAHGVAPYRRRLP
jgi:short-subunit dehydrogenase